MSCTGCPLGSARASCCNGPVLRVAAPKTPASAIRCRAGRFSPGDVPAIPRHSKDGSRAPPHHAPHSVFQYLALKRKFVPSASGSSRLQSRMWGRENRCSQVREAVISFPSHSALLWLRRAMSRWRWGPQGWVGANPTLKFSVSRRLPAVCSGYRHQAIHMSGSGAAMAQPFFFCASNHSIEPGAGTV
jgi:hypothetical protein